MDKILIRFRWVFLLGLVVLITLFGIAGFLYMSRVLIPRQEVRTEYKEMISNPIQDIPDSGKKAISVVVDELIKEEVSFKSINGKEIGKSLIALRVWYVDDKTGQGRSVKVPLVIKLPDNSVLVTSLWWEYLGSIGGNVYEVNEILKFFDDNIRTRELISVVYFPTVEIMQKEYELEKSNSRGAISANTRKLYEIWNSYFDGLDTNLTDLLVKGKYNGEYLLSVDFNSAVFNSEQEIIFKTK